MPGRARYRSTSRVWNVGSAVPAGDRLPHAVDHCFADSAVAPSSASQESKPLWSPGSFAAAVVCPPGSPAEFVRVWAAHCLTSGVRHGSCRTVLHTVLLLHGIVYQTPRCGLTSGLRARDHTAGVSSSGHRELLGRPTALPANFLSGWRWVPEDDRRWRHQDGPVHGMHVRRDTALMACERRAAPLCHGKRHKDGRQKSTWR